MPQVQSLIDDGIIDIDQAYADNSVYFNTMNSWNVDYPNDRIPQVEYPSEQLVLVNSQLLTANQLLASIAIHDFFQNDTAMNNALLQLINYLNDGEYEDELTIIEIITTYYRQYPVVSARLRAYNLMERFILLENLIQDTEYWMKVDSTLHQYLLVEDFAYMNRNRIPFPHYFNISEFINLNWENPLIKQIDIAYPEYLAHLYSKRLNYGDATVLLDILNRDYDSEKVQDDEVDLTILFSIIDLSVIGEKRMKLFLSIITKIWSSRVIDSVIRGIVQRKDIELAVLLNQVANVRIAVVGNIPWFSVELLQYYNLDLRNHGRITHNPETYLAIADRFNDVMNDNEEIVEYILRYTPSRIETTHFNWALDNYRNDLIYKYLDDRTVMVKLPIMRLYDVNSKLAEYIVSKGIEFEVVDLNEVKLITADSVKWYKSIGGGGGWGNWIMDRVNQRSITDEAYLLLTGVTVIDHLELYGKLLRASVDDLTIRSLMVDLLGEETYDDMRTVLYRKERAQLYGAEVGGRAQLSPQWLNNQRNVDEVNPIEFDWADEESESEEE